MLDAEEHSGILTFLGGIVILVLVAVGFSLILDKRFKFSSSREEMRSEIALQTDELKELSRQHEHQSTLLARSSVARVGASQESADLGRRVEALRKQQEFLREKKAGLEKDLAKTGEDFSRYRATYRAKTWSRAVGEKLGNITIRGGREYKDCQITKVTDVGLEIRHEHGIARIQAPDLSAAMQDRFQWNDEERRRRLIDEEERLHGKPEEAVADEEHAEEADDSGLKAAAKARDDKRAELLADREKVRACREKVRSWKRKVAQLKSDLSTARVNSSGSSNSVPGRLETWDERAVRLSKELARAKLELEKARIQLAAVSPSDRELERDPQP